jgi:hypothetical protein
MAFLRTPFGMLIAFVAFAVFALPRMKIDPDVLEELMASRRGGRRRRRARPARAGGQAGRCGGRRAAEAAGGGCVVIKHVCMSFFTLNDRPPLLPLFKTRTTRPPAPTSAPPAQPRRPG